jgi:hypothetical protein
MPTLDDLLKLDDKIILYGSDDHGNRYLGQLLKHYAENFGQSCFSCPKKFPVYLQKLRNHQMKKSDKSKSGFKLRADVILPIFGTSEVYSNENLTDEAALKVLSRNKNAAHLFVQLPKNWEELVIAYKKGLTEIKTIDELTGLSFSQIKILFPNAKGRSKDDLINDIAENYPELNK